VLTGMEMMDCQNLAVPAVVMRHIVDVESGYNPFAIGVVGARLERQPQSLDEALATVRMLEDKGYNFSVGLGQVNRANLGKYGLDSYEKAFSVCPNMVAAARILSECYVSSGGDWGKSFSCYYSGDFVTGYRDGYVQKVFASIGQNAGAAAESGTTAAIPIQMVDATVPTRATSQAVVSARAPDSAAYRVSIRSMVLDTAATAAVSPVAAALTGKVSAAPVPTSPPAKPEIQAPTVASAPSGPAPAGVVPPATPDAPGGGVFVPMVRGPNDASLPVLPVGASNAQAAATPAAPPASDQADLRQGNRDDAFVF
jgi:type IV secretion system protein VirB1